MYGARTRVPQCLGQLRASSKKREARGKWHELEILFTHHVQPVVGSELGAFGHRYRLVLSPVIALVRVSIEHRRPQQRATTTRPNRNVELWEVRLSAVVLFVEVHEERVHARPPRRGHRRVLIVVRAVELPLLIFEHLHVLCVALGDHRQVGDTIPHAREYRVALARPRVAPATEGNDAVRGGSLATA